MVEKVAFTKKYESLWICLTSGRNGMDWIGLLHPQVGNLFIIVNTKLQFYNYGAIFNQYQIKSKLIGLKNW